MKEVLFFCKATSAGEDIFPILNGFICSEKFSWINCIGLYTGGALALP